MQSDQFFRALCNPTRLRILVLLTSEGELCVCELTHAIGASQPHISRHLAQLRELELVTDRRDGLWIHYRISTALPDWVTAVLEHTAAGVVGQAPFASDEQSLAAMANRPATSRCA